MCLCTKGRSWRVGLLPFVYVCASGRREVVCLVVLRWRVPCPKHKRALSPRPLRLLHLCLFTNRSPPSLSPPRHYTTAFSLHGLLTGRDQGRGRRPRRRRAPPAAAAGPRGPAASSTECCGRRRHQARARAGRTGAWPPPSPRGFIFIPARTSRGAAALRAHTPTRSRRAGRGRTRHCPCQRLHRGGVGQRWPPALLRSRNRSPVGGRRNSSAPRASFYNLTSSSSLGLSVSLPPHPSTLSPQPH